MYDVPQETYVINKQQTRTHAQEIIRNHI